MANLKVKVPIEIMDYREHIFLGLSIRQLLWGSIAVACGTVTFLLLRNISMDLATYATMFVAAPAFCMGFIRSKEGYTFEQMLKIRISAFLGKSKRGYETSSDTNIIPVEVIELREIYQEINSAQIEQEKGDDKTATDKKRKKGFSKRTKRKSTTEYDLVEISKKSIKRKRKAALASCKAKRISYREEKYQKKETAC